MFHTTQTLVFYFLREDIELSFYYDGAVRSLGIPFFCQQETPLAVTLSL